MGDLELIDAMARSQMLSGRPEITTATARLS